jgi:hypothetical protein
LLERCANVGDAAKRRVIVAFDEAARFGCDGLASTRLIVFCDGFKARTRARPNEESVASSSCAEYSIEFEQAQSASIHKRKNRDGKLPPLQLLTNDLRNRCFSQHFCFFRTLDARTRAFQGE